MGEPPSEIWQCSECGRSVNGFVNGRRCPSCGEHVSADGRRDAT